MWGLQGCRIPFFSAGLDPSQALLEVVEIFATVLGDDDEVFDADAA